MTPKILLIFLILSFSTASASAVIMSMTVSASPGGFLEEDEVTAYKDVCKGYHLKKIDVILNKKGQAIAVKCLP